MKPQFNLYLFTKLDGSTKFSCDLKDIAEHKIIKDNNVQVNFIVSNDTSEALRGTTEGLIQLVGYFNNCTEGYTTFVDFEGLTGVCLYQRNVSKNPMKNIVDLSDVDTIMKGIEQAIIFFKSIYSKIN